MFDRLANAGVRQLRPAWAPHRRTRRSEGTLEAAQALAQQRPGPRGSSIVAGLFCSVRIRSEPYRGELR